MRAPLRCPVNENAIGSLLVDQVMKAANQPALSLLSAEDVCLEVEPQPGADSSRRKVGGADRWPKMSAREKDGLLDILPLVPPAPQYPSVQDTVRRYSKEPAM